MRYAESRRSFFTNLGAFLISETLGYVAFLVNVPFALSLLFMLSADLIVLQDTYGLNPFGFLARFTQGRKSLHLDGKEFMHLYATASFALFLIWELVRVIFRLKRATLKRHLLSAVILATLGWGFVLVHAPVMRVAPGSSRVGLAMMFALFYVLGLAGFAIGTLITRTSDALIDHLVGSSRTMPTI